ncbi:MAG: Rieske (2Fe-2S) protein [Candidatus Dormibacteria bacterium]
MTREVAVLAQSALHRGEMRRLQLEGVPVCLAHTETGGWWAIDDTCSHEDCSLSEGELLQEQVECPCHGSRFDLRSGEALCLPAVLPVATHPVSLRDGNVVVRLDDDSEGSQEPALAVSAGLPS